jgi:hypothetical protein
MLRDIGFTDIAVGEPVDTFGGAGGEKNARAYEVYGYPFLARKPKASAPSPA